MINNEWKTPIFCFPFLCLTLEFFLFFVQFGIINLDVTQMEAATLCEPEERLWILALRIWKMFNLFFYPNCFWQDHFKPVKDHLVFLCLFVVIGTHLEFNSIDTASKPRSQIGWRHYLDQNCKQYLWKGQKNYVENHLSESNFVIITHICQF